MKNLKFLIFTSLFICNLSFADWHALVIGIDDYRYINDLDGAVNDANDIENALKQHPNAHITKLLDERADYDTVKKWWQDTAQNVHAGDKVIFTMAGHGSIEDEHYPGTDNSGDNKRNNYDETFILYGYHDEAPHSRQRIVDNEMFGWYKKVTDKGAQVIVVADFCYGGGMTRSTSLGRNMEDKRAKYRNGNRGATLKPQDGEKRGSLYDAQLSVYSPEFNKQLFVARPFSDEDKKVPEVNIDGQARGALSYFMANGLRGAADSDHDGITTAAELSSYLYDNSKLVTKNVQDSSLEPSGKNFANVAIFKAQQNSAAAVININNSAKVSLYVNGNSGDLENNSSYYQLVNNENDARYRWQRNNGTMIENGIGIIAYEINNQADLLSFLQNQKLVDELEKISLPKFSGIIALANEKNLDKLSTNVMSNGEEVAIYNKKLNDFPHLIMINIPAKNDLQFINTLSADDLLDLPPSVNSQHVDKLIGKTTVTPPFGSDHLLILAVNDLALKNHKFLNSIITNKKMNITNETRDKLLQIMQSLTKDEARISIIVFSTTNQA